jgi:hypothetical protein
MRVGRGILAPRLVEWWANQSRSSLTLGWRRLRRYAFEVFGSGLKSPTVVLGVDANHNDLTAALTELATVLDHDTASLAAAYAQDDLVAHFQRVCGGFLSVCHSLDGITRVWEGPALDTGQLQPYRGILRGR